MSDLRSYALWRTATAKSEWLFPMQIIEIYKSLQGESSYAGLPCVFVRLAGCNLRCVGATASTPSKAGSA